MKNTLGDRLRELRGEHDLSLRELAKKLGGVTAAHLSDIEFGRRYPSDDLLAKMASFFKVNEVELRALDTRLPMEEIKRLAQTDPAFGLALRKLVDVAGVAGPRRKKSDDVHRTSRPDERPRQ